MKKLVLIALLTANCGQMTVKGKTNHQTRSKIEGETKHTVSLDFSSLKDLCQGQPDEIDCIRTVIDSLDKVINVVTDEVI